VYQAKKKNPAASLVYEVVGRGGERELVGERGGQGRRGGASKEEGRRKTVVKGRERGEKRAGVGEVQGKWWEKGRR
jgi:hypothetical protein